MLLAVDIGNTQTVFGLYEGEALVADFRMASLQGRATDEWAATLLTLLRFRRIEPLAIDAAILCSVVPPLTGIVADALGRYFKVEPLIVGPGIKTGMPILYDPPQDVGADRVVNGIAAHHHARGAAIVVDFGTATTFDAISSRGEYIGGAIAPGIQIGADSLFSRAARLPRVEIRRPPQTIGRSTVQSIQSGLYYGYVCLVQGMLERIGGEMRTPEAADPRVYVTGGLGSTLAGDLKGIDAVIPDLTLQGLRLIYQKNRP